MYSRELQIIWKKVGRELGSMHQLLIDSWDVGIALKNGARRKQACWNGVFTRKSRYDILIKNDEVKKFL